MNATPARHIHFYSRKRLEAWPELAQLTAADIDRLQDRFRSGIDVWTVQTYLQIAPALRERGYTVSIGPKVLAGSILLAHRDDLNTFFGGLHRTFIVSCRADRPRTASADIEILQNALNLCPSREFFIPLWPQPGLISRDPARGDTIQRMAYFGRQDSLPPWFSSPDFRNALSVLGIEFEIRHRAWHDYHDIDLVLAHRIEAPTMLRQKPATKLYNAWLAGVPALLAPEPEYQRMRTAPEDFIEIESPDAVLAAVRQLQTEPARYAVMRTRCAERASEFSAPAIAARWLDLLTGPVADQHDAWLASGGAQRSWLGHAYRVWQQKREAAVFKAQVAEELRQLDAPPPLRSEAPSGPAS